MENIVKSLEQAGNLFTYTNSACECYVDVSHDDNGKEHYTFKVRQKEGDIKYAYAPGVGLCIINKTGSVDQNKLPMDDFLSLKLDKVDELKNYIEKYGFFSTIPEKQYASISFEELKPILKRLQVLVQMISEVSSKEVNYNNLMSWVLKLLLAKPMSVNTTSEIDGRLDTAIHPFTDLWFSYHEIQPRKKPIESLSPDEIDSYDTDIDVIDSFTGKTEKWDLDKQSKLDYDLMDERIKKDGNIQGKVAIVLKYIYLNCPPIHKNGRKVLDFLYHFSEDISPIYSTGDIDTIKVSNSVDLNMKKEFTEQYKNALMEITKDIIKGELDIQLQSVHPAYDRETMSANWTIENMFAAMYFSLFYMRPEYEIYRACANPNCNRLFKVKTTNDRRRYHDHACQNAAAQMRHRKKKRNESPSVD